MRKKKAFSNENWVVYNTTVYICLQINANPNKAVLNNIKEYKIYRGDYKKKNSPKRKKIISTHIHTKSLLIYLEIIFNGYIYL